MMALLPAATSKIFNVVVRAVPVWMVFTARIVTRIFSPVSSTRL